MTIASDGTIHALMDEGLLTDPANRDRVSPASLDFEIGDCVITTYRNPLTLAWQWLVFLTLKFFGFTGEEPAWDEVDISSRTSSNPYWLWPWQAVLVETKEYLTMPEDWAGDIRLVSSRAREGYMHPPTWIDAGYKGKVTLEVSSTRTLFPLPLYPGLRFGQYVFHQCDFPPVFAYGEKGRYQGATTVERAKPGEEI